MPTPPLPDCPGPGPHDAGGDLGGTLFENYNNPAFPYTYACPACFAAANASPDSPMPWPQKDVLSTNS